MPETPHSAAVFHEYRDFWWNRDFVELLARRFELSRVRTLLDVGCGIGHWARVLEPHLAPGARITGIDREAPWLARYGRPAARGDAARLPFADASFDAATCQTVLMHVADPEAVVAEMARVVRPGGLVLAAEPNNVFGSVEFSEASGARPVEDIARVFAFWLTCARGKKALGQGDETIGESLPGMLRRAGLRDVKLYLSDRTSPLQPPYDAPAARAMLATLATLARWRAEKQAPWDEAGLRRRFLAGGGDEDGFSRAWEVLERWWQEDERARAEGTYATAGAGLFFVGGGRKA